MKYYYNNENDEIESVETIRSDYYEVFGDDYETFDDYLNACMAENNGALTDVVIMHKRVKRELNKKLALAQKYSMEEYEEEILYLLSELDRYGKYIRSAT